MRGNKTFRKKKQKKNICSPFGRPDVTRPKITTHARTHTSAHKQVPPPGGFSSPKYTCLLGYSLMREGGEKKRENKPSLRRCASFKQDSVYRFCSLCCISNNGGVGRRQHETARVCACMCVRVSRTAVPSGGIFELFYLLRGCCALSSAMVKLDGHVWRPARLFRGRRLLTWRVPFDSTVRSRKKRGEKKYLPVSPW